MSLLLALHRLRGVVARAAAQHRRELGDGLRGREDLAAGGERCHARGDVDRVAEDVAGVLDRRAGVEADVHRQPRAAAGSLRGHAHLDLDRGLRRRVGGRERRQDLVAYRLDDVAAGVAAHALDDRQAAVDRLLCVGVAEHFVQLGAAGNVGEQDGEVARGGGHAAIARRIVASIRHDIGRGPGSLRLPSIHVDLTGVPA